MPYRPCVGVVVFNNDGLVFIGRRAGLSESDPYPWQMPQGGIDGDEDPLAAATRELHEETGIQSVNLLAEAPEWLHYDLPPGSGKRWINKYRGQTQRWFAFKFLGDDSEVRLDLHGKPEFDTWRWMALSKIPDLVVPFKRPVYERVATIFEPLARSGGEIA